MLMEDVDEETKRRLFEQEVDEMVKHIVDRIKKFIVNEQQSVLLAKSEDRL
mgnify:CR=1 FL=1